MTPAPACCRCRRSPIRRPITGPAPRCATTTSRARWCMRSNTATGSTSRPPWGAGWRAPGANCWRTPMRSIPVPLHWRRLWARRFNQSALLAKAIAQESGIAVADAALKRVKATAQQVGLSQAERAAKCAGRLPRARRAQGRGRRPPPRSDRRRADLRRHLGCLRAGAAAGRRPQRRPAGVRAGCRRGASPHINWLSKRAKQTAMAPVEIYTTPLLPLLHRCQGASEEEERRLHRDRRVARPGFASEDDRSAPTAAPRCRRFSSARPMSAAATISMRSRAQGKLDPLLERTGLRMTGTDLSRRTDPDAGRPIARSQSRRRRQTDRRGQGRPAPITCRRRR